MISSPSMRSRSRFVSWFRTSRTGETARRAVGPGPRVPPGGVRGQQEPLAEDDVDLVRPDRVAEFEGEEDDVDETVGGLDLRALVALDDVLGDKLVEPEQAGDPPDEGRVRGGQGGPGRAGAPAGGGPDPRPAPGAGPAAGAGARTRRPPRASAGISATAVTIAATRKIPTRIRAASLEAQLSRAWTTRPSRSGRARGGARMESLYESAVA